VPDGLLPTDYGVDPLAEEEQIDEVLTADEDTSWGAESPRRPPPPKEEELPMVLPAPVEYLEEVTDEPRRKKKKTVAGLRISGRNGSLRLSGMDLIIDYDGDDDGDYGLDPDGGDEGSYTFNILALSKFYMVQGGDGYGIYVRVVTPRRSGQKSRRRGDADVEEFLITFDRRQGQEVARFEQLVYAFWQAVLKEGRIKHR
jgi:hypothetical protein